ncbi:hypothetical protein ABIA35_000568 [Catenulispora sp. MAP12-49]|uniref:hypothetical protein n=1 Tax=Catenulispora sp. MAP12-49 TaxID=3156302 RepID=UPI0035151F45
MAQRKTVRLGGKQLRVATKLAPATNTARGYCPTCSGLGTHGKTKAGKARPCRRCNGTGRAATPAKPATKPPAKKPAEGAPKPGPARTSGQTVAARRPAASGTGARTAYGAAANRRSADRKTKKTAKKTSTVLRLFGIGGKRLPVNRAVRGWARGAFGTRTTTTTAQARARNNRSFGQTIAIGGNPGASWWRCPRCAASETGLRDADTAVGRAAAHWAGTHPGAPFRLDPQGPNTTDSRKG